MPTVSFTPNIQRHVSCPTTGVEGETGRQALDAVFHTVVFVDGRQVRDRQHLSDPVPRDGEIYVAQALSGG